MTTTRGATEIDTRGSWCGLLAAALILLNAPSAAALPPSQAPLLDPIFQDHAVLQRDEPLRFWGEALPGDEITVSIGSSIGHARVDAHGHWQLSLPPMGAGGPFPLSAQAKSGASQVLADVLVGDVWLCSGQSNMELPVSSTLSAEREAGASTNDLIRVLSIAHATSPAPLQHLGSPVAWHAAGPTSIREFSAACYYFARELQKSVRVPLGLIQSTWPGSSIETWIGESSLRTLRGYDELLDLLRLYAHDAHDGNRGFARLWESWWRERAGTGSTPWAAVVADPTAWQAMPEPMRDWKTWGVPELKNHDGMVWFRRTFELSPEQAVGAADISLGGIDEVDETWVNGSEVGNSFGWGTERTYRVPAGLLHAGTNSVVVNVLSTWDAGGMYGPPDHMNVKCANGNAVSLASSWRYQFVPDRFGYPPRAPWESIGGLSSVFNAMIAPLGHYALRGVAWYQGESNTGAAAKYQHLLAGLMADWRRNFRPDLPFLIVQLPNFGAPSAAPAASDWADLREAQRRAVAADTHAALAVTIDIGDPHELHPPNKQDVGRRLAQAARHLVYGESVSPSGPVPVTAHREQDRIVLSFKDAEGGLVAYSSADPIGFELCRADQSSCRYVHAILKADGVEIGGANTAEATRVRFCWGDAPTCNLHDRAGLPAGPFEIEIH